MSGTSRTVRLLVLSAFTSRTVAWVVGNTATKRLSRNAWKNETDGSRLSKGEEIIRK